MSTIGSSTTIYAHDKPIVTLAHIECPDFHSLTIYYGGSEVKFFIDTLAEVEDLAAKINEQIEAQKIAAKMIAAHPMVIIAKRGKENENNARAV